MQNDLEVRLSILQAAYEHFLEAGGLAQFDRFEALERGLKQGYLTIVLHNTNACPKCKMWTSQTVCPNCKTQLGCDDANPGCLSQMAEQKQPDSFKCHGCDAVIEIDDSIPARRVFEWANGTTGEKHPYCFKCDDILIQDGELPNAKKKREVQS